jgi:hypothetical protein
MREPILVPSIFTVNESIKFLCLINLDILMLLKVFCKIKLNLEIKSIFKCNFYISLI